MITKISLSQQHIQGTWRLIKHGIYSHAGIFTPTTEVMAGLLTYTDSTVHVLILKNKNPQQSSDLITYFGYYRIDQEGIHHQILLAPDPKRMGKVELRIPSLSKDLLTLTTKPDETGHFMAVWQKENSVESQHLFFQQD